MGAVIYEDTRQQNHGGNDKHIIKHEWLKLHGITVARKKLDFGDYQTDGSNISIDTKRNIAEIAQNINGKNHDRFKREILRAREAGYRLIILVENREGVTCLDDLKSWMNDHCVKCGTRKKTSCNPYDGQKCLRHGTRKPIQGNRLAKAMSTMSERYGVRFEFCNPQETAKRICELLGVKYEQDAASGETASRDGVQDTPD